jgi:DNA polymerase III subunit beta
MDNPTLDANTLSDNLRTALAAVKRAINPHTKLPILSYGMIETDNGRLTLSATNLEWAISYTISARVEGEGSAVLPVHQLAASLPAKPAGPVHIMANGKDVQVTLPGGAALAYRTELPADYPSRVRVPDRDPDISWGGADLARAIAAVTPAAASDAERPLLAGVQLEIHEDYTNFVAADSFRLSMTQAAPYVENLDLAGRKIIIPAKALRELAKIIGKAAESVEMWHLVERNQVIFAADNWTFVSQLIVGVFPDYRQIIPVSSPYRTVAETAALTAAVKAAAPIAKQANNILRLVRNNGSLTVIAVAAEGGNVAIAVPATGEGEGRWALNTKYLADALATITTEHVAFYTTSPSLPVLIRPVEAAPILEWVVMPMYVAD